MLKRLLLALLLLTATSHAAATDYTDIWYIPAESGWGVNAVQNEAVIFLTFFIYGPDNKPTWYDAILYKDTNGNFNGALYLANGTYFAVPWVMPNTPGVQVGTASFFPTSPYTATLIYTVNGVPMVTKSIQRQTLTTIALGGSYSGAQAGTYSGCATSFSYKDFLDLQATQLTTGAVTFAFTYQSGLTCRLSGTLAQYGQLYTVPTATYRCSDGLSTSASMSEIKATAQGIEGRFASPSVGGGCREDAQFSATLR